MEKSKRPLVGVGVFIYDFNHRVLLGKRKGAHGQGEWSLPGGHLEFNESFRECCIREVKEETDIDIHTVKKIGFTNDIFESDGLHYVTLFFETKLEGLPIRHIAKVMEPDKCEEWKWFDLNELPSPLFPPLRQIIKKKSVIEF